MVRRMRVSLIVLPFEVTKTVEARAEMLVISLEKLLFSIGHRVYAVLSRPIIYQRLFGSRTFSSVQKVLIGRNGNAIFIVTDRLHPYPLWIKYRVISVQHNSLLFS